MINQSKNVFWNLLITHMINMNSFKLKKFIKMIWSRRKEKCHFSSKGEVHQNSTGEGEKYGKKDQSLPDPAF